MATSATDDRPIAVLAFTRRGARLGATVAASLGPAETLHVARRWLDEAPPGAQAIDGLASAAVATLFPHVRALVMMLAVGAAVRLTAPLLSSKQHDPAVLSIDETGRFVVPVAGGHRGGANDLARLIAAHIGAVAVITTASDALGLPALDTLGRGDGWKVEASPDALKQAMAAAIDGEALAIYQDAGLTRPIDDIPEEWPRLASPEELAAWDGPALVVSDRLLDHAPTGAAGPHVVYRPPTLVVGVGTSTGAPPDEVEALVRDTLINSGLAIASVGVVATIDRRAAEPAVVALGSSLGAQVWTYPADWLAAVAGTPNPSPAVERRVGTPGVCEPAAILASEGGALLVSKVKSAHATVAIARRATRSAVPGALRLVGLGPGRLDFMTPAARRALDDADVVIGYKGYLESLDEIVPAHRMQPYSLGQERDRAHEAIRLAQAGQTVVLVSSGDVGIYGMAGLVFELLAETDAAPGQPLPVVEVVPGVTAATAAASLLGAPLMLDYAAISLSDLLVPWDTIERRLMAAAEGDLTIVLYNPASKRRRAGLERAREIILQHRPATTPVGIVREAYRLDQAVAVSTLGDLPLDQVDMRTVLVIGCSRTVVLDGRMVTRRGYQDGQSIELERPTISSE